MAEQHGLMSAAPFMNSGLDDGRLGRSDWGGQPRTPRALGSALGMLARPPSTSCHEPGPAENHPSPMLWLGKEGEKGIVVA